MAQSIFLSIVLSTLIVLHLATTTKAYWQKCFDDSCPIKYIKFSSKSSSRDISGGLDRDKTTYSSNDDGVRFEMQAPASGIPGQTIDIEWDDDNVLFTCSVRVVTIYKDNYTIQTITDYNIAPEINGTAIYFNDKLYCSWAIKISNSTFPYELIDPPQYYISESGYQIYYNLTQTVPIAAANYSQLPASVEPFVDGYEYKAVGSEKYLLIARIANDSTDFLLKVNGETPRLVEVNLKSDISINIDCNFEEGTFTMSTKFYDTESVVWFLQPGRIDGDECLWSLSDSLKVRSFPAKLKETIYELQIIENKRFVYFDEKNFRIITPTSASSSLIIAKSLLVFSLISVIFM
ncbi:uncharacterized protein LOC107361298 [Tetranychus urticae]|uniref:uncharacterized protein LOC107361298 n=1 Tax=Tetranychus urticae TaxID=32264 RepID=UPI00077BB6AD|nr:uncharacterized protein LOC107361298 [Tetranychus urticae]